MKLQEKIKNDLKAAMKTGDTIRKDTIRIAMGEFGRLEKKELSDEEVIKVLKKLIKSERETLEKKGDREDSEFIRVIEEYLPKQASDEEIRLWIDQNVDFTAFKSKMQAMGPIMKHFGTAADGNTVKKILQDL